MPNNNKSRSLSLYIKDCKNPILRNIGPNEAFLSLTRLFQAIYDEEPELVDELLKKDPIAKAMVFEGLPDDPEGDDNNGD